MEHKRILVAGKWRQAATVLAKMRSWTRSPSSAAFLKNFGITFIFKALSLLLTLIVYVLAVRELGVITWGQIALIASVANIMLIPLTFGLHNGVIKYVPVSTKEESKELMGTALIANLIPSCMTSILLIAAAPVVESWFGFPLMNWIAAVALAMSINLYILTESFLRGQQLFFRLGLYKLIASIVFLVGTAIGLYMLGERSITSYMIPLIAQNVYFFVHALLKSGLSPWRYSFKLLKKLFSYSLFTMFSWLVSALLFTSDLFYVAHFGEQYELGVYSIYQNTIRNLCSVLFHDVFAVVFMPLIAVLNRRDVDAMVMKYSAPIFMLIWLGAAMLTTVLVLLYGVPLTWTYVGLTSAGIAMNMMYLLMTTVIAMDGVKAARCVFAALVIPIPALQYLQYVLVKHWGMIGGMSSVIVINICLLIALRITIRYFYHFQSVPLEREGSA